MNDADWRAACRAAAAYLQAAGFADAHVLPASTTGADVSASHVLARVDWHTMPCDRGAVRVTAETARAQRKHPVVFTRSGLATSAAAYADVHDVAHFNAVDDGWRPANASARVLLDTVPACATRPTDLERSSAALRRSFREILTARGLAGGLDSPLREQVDELISRAAARGGDPEQALRAEVAALTTMPDERMRAVLVELAHAALPRLRPGPKAPLPSTPRRVDTTWRGWQQRDVVTPAFAAAPRRRRIRRRLLLVIALAGVLSLIPLTRVRALHAHTGLGPSSINGFTATAPGVTPANREDFGAAPVGLAWAIGACADDSAGTFALVPCTSAHTMRAVAEVTDKSLCPAPNWMVRSRTAERYLCFRPDNAAATNPASGTGGFPTPAAGQLGMTLGACANFEPDNRITLVPCTAAHTLVAVAEIATGQHCPDRGDTVVPAPDFSRFMCFAPAFSSTG